MKNRFKYLLTLFLLAAMHIVVAAQSISVNPSRLVFPTSVVAGSASPSNYLIVTTNNIVGNFTIKPSSQVEISTSQLAVFSNSAMVCNAADYSSGTKIYVRFAPKCSGFADSVIAGSLTFYDEANNLLQGLIVQGTVKQQENSSTGGHIFKVATFNAEWLGCTDNASAACKPRDGSLQMRNVAEVIRGIDADVIGLQEVCMNPVKSLDSVLSHLGDTWGGTVVLYNSGTCYQSEAIVYKKSTVSVSGTPRLMSSAGNWPAGRQPVEFKLNVSIAGKVVPITLVNLHAKAYSDAASYATRVSNSTSLKTLLDGSYKTQNLIVLGDFNDRLSGSQCSSCGNSPYKNFIDDAPNYKFLTQNLSGYDRGIDHIMMGKELYSYYVSSTVKQETGVTGGIANYRCSTSDHTPISAKFSFGRQLQHFSIQDYYTKYRQENSLSLPAKSKEGLSITYAIDSGYVASISGSVVTFVDTGVVRLVAYQAGDSENAPTAQFFYVQITSQGVAPNIIVQPQSQVIGLGATATFTIQAKGTDLQYQWRKDGQDIAGAMYYTYTVDSALYQDAAYYTCVVFNDLGELVSQQASLTVNGKKPTAIPKNAYATYLRLYPNPTQHTLTISSESGNIATVRVINLNGIVIYEQQGINDLQYNITTSAWQNGLYIVTVYSEKGQVGSKMILKN